MLGQMRLAEYHCAQSSSHPQGIGKCKTLVGPTSALRAVSPARIVTRRTTRSTRQPTPAVSMLEPRGERPRSPAWNSSTGPGDGPPRPNVHFGLPGPAFGTHGDIDHRFAVTTSGFTERERRDPLRESQRRTAVPAREHVMSREPAQWAYAAYRRRLSRPGSRPASTGP